MTIGSAIVASVAIICVTFTAVCVMSMIFMKMRNTK